MKKRIICIVLTIGLLYIGFSSHCTPTVKACGLPINVNIDN